MGTVTKKKKKNKSDYGENFIPPDGGYGWIICVAVGLANLSLFVMFEQFGILYYGKLFYIGLSHSDISTIINVCISVYSLTGCVNGPIFRKFSHRQVGMTGSLIATFAIFLTSFANTFGSFLFTFGILLAFGSGISNSTNILILNVYFKENRSKASSCAWTITGIGAIVFPYITTYLVEIFGVQGAILIVTAISANSFAFSMTYQPVLWHAKTNKSMEQQLELLNGYKKITELTKDVICEICYRPMVDLHVIVPFKEKPAQISKCICHESKVIKTEESNDLITSIVKPKRSVFSKVISYFELDLLKNYTFLNIIVGLTLSYLADLNFIFLTPFFLKDFGFDSHEVAFLMSIPSIPDLTCRFLIQFIVKKVKWSNRIFYLFGITCLTISRIVITLRPPYIVMCIAFIFVGIGKAFLVVFLGIIIPDYVPLKSLPAAVGISRLFDGIFPVICGSIVGFIRDVSNYQIALQILNLLTTITVISWTAELFLNRNNKK